MTKLIIVGALVVGAMLFLATYEGFSLLYFEEDAADKIALYAGVPILGVGSIFLFADKYRHSLKDNKLVDAVKHSLAGLVGVGVLYYFIVMPVISGAVIWTNAISGGENVLVSGVVIGKTEIEGTKLSEFELTVKSESEIITWKTNRIEVSKYQVGDNFIMEMQKGIWGLLTRHK